LFGEAGEDLPAPRLSSPEDWLPTERLTHEHSAVGFYLTGHPLDDYLGALQRKRILPYADLVAATAKGKIATRIAGTVLSCQERKSQKGNRYAFVQLSDPTGLYEATVFADTLEKNRDLLEPGKAVILTIEAESENDQIRMRVQGVQDIDAATSDAGEAGLKIFINNEAAVPAISARLQDIKSPNKLRGGPISIIATLTDSEVEIELKGKYIVTPQVTGAIKSANGVTHVESF